MWLLVALIISFWFYPDLISAHAVGEVYALPVPLRYYLWSSAIAVGVSFGVLSFFLKGETGVGKIKSFTIPWFGSLLSFLRWGSVGLLLLAIVAGLFGNQDPTSNITPLLFWIGFLLGGLLLSAMVGNIWDTTNPWRTLSEWSNQNESKPKRVISSWIAPLLLFGLYWLELISPHPYQPQFLAKLLLAYTLLNLLAARFFHNWFQDGEVFSVLFRYVGTIAPWRLRGQPASLTFVPYLLGFAKRNVTWGLLFFAFVLLAGTSFDSLKETIIWYQWMDRLGVKSGLAYNLAQSVVLGLLPLPGLVAYGLALWQMAKLTKTHEWLSLTKVFVWSLAPIALGYILAHNIPLLTSTVPLLLALISDPFGFGWNLFGTASLAETSFVLGAKTLWFIELICIISAHIGGVWIAHLIALMRFPDRKTAVISQLPILCLMLLYTVTTLWLLSQPLVASPK